MPFRVDTSARVFATLTTRGTHNGGVITGAVSGAAVLTGFAFLLADLATPSWESNKSGLDWATGFFFTTGVASFFVAMTLLAAGSHARVTPR